MKKIKDDNLSILFTVFQYKKQNIFALAVLCGFEIDRPRNLLDEADMWDRVSRALGDNILDPVMPKLYGEVLVVGKCFAPGGSAVPASRSSFRVGDISKSVYVFGNRSWKKSAGIMNIISDPEPFTEMDISWNRAFGGPGFDANPEGTGIAASQPGDGVISLPNIENPRNIIGSPSDRPAPVGFAPMGVQWPGRLKNLGTFDSQWLRENWPGFPDDFDFGYFNRAPRDQSVKGFFRGDEAVEIQNMHPEQSMIQSRLPGIRPRCFILSRRDDSDVFKELKMQLDTVWLFPHLNTGTLIWRGLTGVSDDEASEISHVLAFYEYLDHEPAPADMYMKKIEEETAEPAEAAMPDIELAEFQPWEVEKTAVSMAGIGTAAAAVITPGELRADTGTAVIPEAPPAVEKPQPAVEIPEKAIPGEELHAPPGVFPGREEREKEDIRLKGHVPEELLKKEEPDRAKMLYVESLSPGHLVSEMEHHVDDLKKQLDERLRECGIDPDNPPLPLELPAMIDFPETESAAIDRLEPEDLVREMERWSEGLKQEFEARIREHGIDPNEAVEAPEPIPRKTAQEMVDSCKRMGFHDQEFFDQLYRIEAELKKADSLIAEYLKEPEAGQLSDESGYQPGMESPPEKDSLPGGGDIITRSGEQAVPPAGEESGKDVPGSMDFAGKDLTGIDLSGKNLQDIDFSGAILEGANLSGAVLTGANLSGAILTGAMLSGASLVKATLTGISASRASFVEADLKEADLSDSDFTGGDFTGADLTGTVLKGAHFSGASFRKTHCRKTQSDSADFTNADLSGADFSFSEFSHADLSGAVLEKTNFTRAVLQNTWLSEAKGNDSLFVEANMRKSRVNGKTLFSSSDFSGADMTNARWQEADFPGSQFKNVNLTDSSLTGCSFAHADLSGINAQHADFSKSDFSFARMKEINLFKGSLRKAKLEQTDFTGANLYGVDFFKAGIRDANFEKANLDNTLLAQRRPA